MVLGRAARRGRRGHADHAAGLRPARPPLAPRPALVAVLHRRDGGHGRLRRLQLRHPVPRHARLRHRADLPRRGTAHHRLRPVHQHPRHPPDRALARSQRRDWDDRPRRGDRPRLGGDRRGARPRRRGQAGGGGRAGPRQPLPRPGASPRGPHRDRRCHAVRDAPHGPPRRRQRHRRAHQRGSDEHRDRPHGRASPSGTAGRTCPWRCGSTTASWPG